jgi:hypothetical protein
MVVTSWPGELLRRPWLALSFVVLLRLLHFQIEHALLW